MIQTAPSELVELKLSDIRVDYALQPRVHPIDDDHAAGLAEAYRDGMRVPPPTVFSLTDEPGVMLLSRGFHRARGAAMAGLKRLVVEVRSGSRQDAVIDAASTTLEHCALRMGLDDRRRAVKLIYQSSPPNISASAISVRTGVDRETCEKIVREINPDRVAMPTRVGADGREVVVNSTPNGKTASPATGPRKKNRLSVVTPRRVPTRLIFPTAPTQQLAPSATEPTSEPTSEAERLVVRMGEWVKQLRGVRQDVLAAFSTPGHPVARTLGLDDLTAKLEEAVEAIEGATPRQPCPVCQEVTADGRRVCAMCGGFGHVPASVAEKLSKRRTAQKEPA